MSKKEVRENAHKVGVVAKQALRLVDPVTGSTRDETVLTAKFNCNRIEEV